MFYLMRKLSPLMRRAASSEPAPEADTWIDQELAERQFKDVRLLQRFRKLLGQIASAVGQTIPFVCQGLGEYEGGLPLFFQ